MEIGASVQAPEPCARPFASELGVGAGRVAPSRCRSPGVSPPEKFWDCICKILQSNILVYLWLATDSQCHPLTLYQWECTFPGVLPRNDPPAGRLWARYTHGPRTFVTDALDFVIISNSWTCDRLDYWKYDILWEDYACIFVARHQRMKKIELVRLSHSKAPKKVNNPHVQSFCMESTIRRPGFFRYCLDFKLVFPQITALQQRLCSVIFVNAYSARTVASLRNSLSWWWNAISRLEGGYPVAVDLPTRPYRRRVMLATAKWRMLKW